MSFLCSFLATSSDLFSSEESSQDKNATEISYPKEETTLLEDFEEHTFNSSKLSIDLSEAKWRKGKKSRWKGPCDVKDSRLVMIDDCGRLGNLLSQYAGVLALARLIGAEPVVQSVRNITVVS